MAPINPLDPANLQRLHSLVTDIVSKLDQVGGRDDVGLFRVDVGRLHDMNQGLDKQADLAERLSKIWKRGGKDLQKIVEQRKKYLQQVKEEKAVVSDLEKMLRKQEKVLNRITDVQRKAEQQKVVDRLKDEIAARKRLTQAIQDQSDNLEKLSGRSLGYSALNGVIEKLSDLGKWLAKTQLKIFVGSLAAVGAQLKILFGYAEKWTSIFGHMSRSLGMGTAGLTEFKDQARELFRGDWGGLGLSAEQSAKKVTELVESFGFTDAGLSKQLKNWGDYAIKLGVADAEIGSTAKNLRMMGFEMQDVGTYLGDLIPMAKAARVATSVMAKEFLVAGKNMISWVGPKNQENLKRAAVYVTGLGISMQALEAFTKKTDVFDETAESIAKMNTVFGLHVNAMDVFLEQDPAKRLEKIAIGFEMQGKSLADLGRQEMTMVQQVTGLEANAIRALGNSVKQNRKTYAEALKDYEKEQSRSQKKQADADEGMRQFATTLLNVERVLDRLQAAGMRFIRPFLKQMGWGEGFENVNDLFFKKDGGLLNRVDEWVKNNGEKFAPVMMAMADSFKSIGESMVKIVESKEFASLIRSVGENTVEWLKTLDGFFKTFDAHKGGIFGFFEKMLENAKSILTAWVAIQGAMMGGQAGAAIGSFFGPAGTVIGGAIGAAVGGATGYGVAHAAIGNNSGNVLSVQEEAVRQAKIQTYVEQSGGGVDSSPRAAGGIVSPGQVYTVGERGPEPFVPMVPGKVLPAGSGGDTIVQVILDGELIQSAIAKSAVRRHV